MRNPRRSGLATMHPGNCSSTCSARSSTSCSRRSRQAWSRPNAAESCGRFVLEYLATAWRQPDEGIWEVRGGSQHFVHSKVMAWVAFDRAANELESRVFNESGQRWREIADEIHAEVCERGFDRDLNAFVQAYGSKRLDASLLLLPLVGFLPAADPRIRGTLRAIEDRLLIDGEFVLRYETENAGDGLPAGEGAFLACSFLLVDNYILQGRYSEAQKLFDRLLSHGKPDRFSDRPCLLHGP